MRWFLWVQRYLCCFREFGAKICKFSWAESDNDSCANYCRHWFLGAGSIILQGSQLRGLTTAGGLWVTAGIGMAAGLGFYGLALIVTVLVLLILTLVNIFEKPIRKISAEADQI